MPCQAENKLTKINKILTKNEHKMHKFYTYSLIQLIDINL